jgi:hypothetical protein
LELRNEIHRNKENSTYHLERWSFFGVDYNIDFLLPDYFCFFIKIIIHNYSDIRYIIVIVDRDKSGRFYL